MQVTCGVAKPVLDEVLGAIKRSLKAGGVKVRLITSGTGDWRFLDIVSVRAGKLEVRAASVSSHPMLHTCIDCSTCYPTLFCPSGLDHGHLSRFIAVLYARHGFSC